MVLECFLDQQTDQLNTSLVWLGDQLVPLNPAKISNPPLACFFQQGSTSVTPFRQKHHTWLTHTCPKHSWRQMDLGQCSHGRRWKERKAMRCTSQWHPAQITHKQAKLLKHILSWIIKNIFIEIFSDLKKKIILNYHTF